MLAVTVDALIILLSLQDRFVVVSMGTVIALLLSFYDAHLSFYNNYWHMLSRWAQVGFRRYFLGWPPRPMMFLYLPGIVYSVITITKALIPGTGDESKKES
jgi:hypothetical protein